MSPMRYVVPAGQRIFLSTDKETHSAVKKYAKENNMTMTAAFHLIINRGLRFMIFVEEKAERDYNLKILQLGREFYGKEKIAEIVRKVEKEEEKVIRQLRVREQPWKDNQNNWIAIGWCSFFCIKMKGHRKSKNRAANLGGPQPQMPAGAEYWKS